MQEFDLNSIWRQADEKAESWYQKLRPELEAMARQKNDSVLQRIRRMVEMEMAFSVLMTIGFGIYGRQIPPLILALVLVTLVFLLLVSYRYYRIFRQQIEAVPTMDIRASTAAFLEHLGAYKKRLIRLSIIFMPFGLAIGFAAGFSIGSDNDFEKVNEPEFWLTTLPVLLVMMALSYFFVRWYYRFFIGTKEDELKAVLLRLDEEEEA